MPVTKSPLFFLGFYSPVSRTSQEHPHRAGELQVLRGHPSPDRQADSLEASQDQRAHRSYLQTKAQTESVCRSGLVHWDSYATCELEKGRLQLRGRTKDCHGPASGTFSPQLRKSKRLGSLEPWVF